MTKLFKGKVDLKILEKELFAWTEKKKLRLVLITLFLGLLFAIRNLPYLNLILTPGVCLVAIIIVSVFLLDIGKRIVFGMAMFVLFWSLVFLLLKGGEQAELLGNYTYGLFLIGVIKSILEGGG